MRRLLLRCVSMLGYFLMLQDLNHMSECGGLELPVGRGATAIARTRHTYHGRLLRQFDCRKVCNQPPIQRDERISIEFVRSIHTSTPAASPADGKEVGGGRSGIRLRILRIKGRLYLQTDEPGADIDHEIVRHTLRSRVGRPAIQQEIGANQMLCSSSQFQFTAILPITLVPQLQSVVVRFAAKRRIPASK